jgi:hypothetical protein
MPEFVVDSLDTVDESIRGAYVEKDGKFTLDVDKYAEVSPKTQGLKKKNAELLTKNKAASDGLKKFEKFAEFDESDLEELLELRANKDKPGKDNPADDERLAQLEKQHKKALDKLTGEKTSTETRASELEKELKHYKLTVPVRDAAAKAGVIAEDLDLVILDTQKRFALNDESKIVVLDEDGDPTDITLAKFFELYKEQRPKFYAASGAGGSGAPANTSSGTAGKSMKMADFHNLGREQQKAFMTEVSAGKAKLID